MNAFSLYQQFRKSGSRSDEAAALTGYAVLLQQGAWVHLKISRRHTKKIKRAFHKLELSPECLDIMPSTSDFHQRDGVVLSGQL